MPSAAGSACGHHGADIVLGDCHGAACAPQILEAARSFLLDRGFAVAINAPYAGGFTTGCYGRPGARRHALQIEISRALYMEERSYRRKPRLARLVKDMAELVEHLGQVLDFDAAAALVKKTMAKVEAKKPKAKLRRQVDDTLQAETTEEDLDRRDLFSEMKKREF